jgi:hypothetical protein
MDDEIPKHRKRGKKKKYQLVYSTMGGKQLHFKQKYANLKAAEQALENFNNGKGGWPNNKDYTAKIEEI